MSGAQNPRVTQADEAIQALVDNYSTAGANLLDWLDATDLAAMPGKHASEQKWRDWGNDVACRATFRALSQAKDVAARHREAAEAASKAREAALVEAADKIEALVPMPGNDRQINGTYAQGVFDALQIVRAALSGSQT